jgi:hypothetical protein
MTLSETVLGVMLALHPAKPGDADRLAPLANAIATEAEASPLWPGETGALRTAMIAASVAVHESGLLDDVRSCKRRGDHGSSLGWFQLHSPFAWGGHSAEEICSDDALQTRLALRIMTIQRDRGVSAPDAILRAYASGSAGRDSKAARELAATYRRALRLAAEEADGCEAHAGCASSL